MDFNWIAIEVGEVAWIIVAFAFGLLARVVGLPPMIGFLTAGFVLGAHGVEESDLLRKISDVGITLLLFTIGLKLNLKTLARPQVWGVASIHLLVVSNLFGLAFLGLAVSGLTAFAELDLQGAFLVAFALSFSSTVFVVKVVEERGEMASLHGRIAIGVLIVQDIAAVVFLAISTAKMPSVWALLVISLLYPLRPLLFRLLGRVGHGELMVLYGFVLALGGAEVFELVGMKGDLGALIMGVLIASHAQSDELNKAMLGFKDLFLLGFVMSVGLSGTPSLSSLGVAALLVPLVLFKSALFFSLFTRFRLRARTALLASIDLGNFSEFGLIVAAVAAYNGWISYDWLVIIAIALALSFVLAAVINRFSYALYEQHRGLWTRFQHSRRLAFDRSIKIDGARVMVVGMGGVGTGAFEMMSQELPGQVIGVDIDPDTVKSHVNEGRSVVRGDPSGADFWERLKKLENVELMMINLPKNSIALAVITELRSIGYKGEIAAVARYPDEAEELGQAGADAVFNIYSEAGTGFASHVMDRLQNSRSNGDELVKQKTTWSDTP